MKSLRLEVGSLGVDLRTLDGHHEQISVFVSVPAGMTSLAAALAAQLEDRSLEFLPCRVGGRTSLLRIGWIASLEIAAELPDWRSLEEVGAIAHRVDVDLVNGDRVSGTLMVEGSEEARRVSDYLNRRAGRFVLVRTESAATYVNRHAIARVGLEETE